MGCAECDLLVDVPLRLGARQRCLCPRCGHVLSSGNLDRARPAFPFAISAAVRYRVTENIGRWSMIDVFVVAMLLALIKLGDVLSFYPRLIWDRVSPKTRVNVHE